MQLACLMPVGPGEAARHLERCLKAAREWADVLLVYGDAPDPASRELIERYANHAWVGEENLYERGEHLMRNEMWHLADVYLDPGDIVSCLDADEQFAESPTRVREVLRGLEHDPRCSFRVEFFHLWNTDGTLHRVDGAWRPSAGPRICRFEQGIELKPLHETAWVCPPLPPRMLLEHSAPVLHILHWSYANERDRAPKVERYTRLLGHDLRHVNSIVEHPTLEPVPCFS